VFAVTLQDSSKSLVKKRHQRVLKKSLPALDWISMYALAVNEGENYFFSGLFGEFSNIDFFF
jgi:L-serine deaminase